MRTSRFCNKRPFGKQPRCPQVRRMADIVSSMIRYSLLTLFVVVTVTGSVFGLGRAYGAHGVILPFDLLVICWAVASLCGTEQVFGRRIRKLTVTDIIALLFTCYVMHGLAMPAVQTGGHPRRSFPPAGPVIPQVPLSPTDGGSGAGTSQILTL